MGDSDVFWEHENCLDFHANKINPFVQNLRQRIKSSYTYHALNSYISGGFLRHGSI